MASDVKLTESGVILEGNVGVGGVNKPEHRMDVSGRIRLRKSGDTAGLWLYQGNPGKDLAFVGMSNDAQVGFWGNTGAQWGFVMDTSSGNVGIGASNPTERLEVGGTVKSENVVAKQSVSCQKINLLNQKNLPVKQTNALNDAQSKLAAAGAKMSGAMAQANANPSNAVLQNNFIQAQAEFQKANAELQLAAAAIQRPAFAHEKGDRLSINKNRNFTGGAEIAGNVSLNGRMVITEGSIKIRYSLTEAAQAAASRNPVKDQLIGSSPAPGGGFTVPVAAANSLKNGINIQELGSLTGMSLDDFSVTKADLSKLGLGEIDLVQSLLQLQAKVGELEKQIAALKTK